MSIINKLKDLEIETEQEIDSLINRYLYGEDKRIVTAYRKCGFTLYNVVCEQSLLKEVEWIKRARLCEVIKAEEKFKVPAFDHINDFSFATINKLTYCFYR